MAAGVLRRAIMQPAPLKFFQSTISLKCNQFQLPLIWNGKQIASTANRKIKEDLYSPFTICSEFPPLVSKGDFESTLITEDHYIRQAQALLYENYKGNKWTWNKNNSTGFQMRNYRGQKYVTDKFDDNSVVWIGTFGQRELVTAIRLNFRTQENPLLDMEGYESTYKPSIQKMIGSKNIAEISRFVTAPDYRSSGIGGTYSLLVLFMLLSKNNYEAIFTSQLDFFGKYSIGTLMDREFDYGDGIHTKAWFYSKDDIAKIISMLTKRVKS